MPLFTQKNASPVENEFTSLQKDQLLKPYLKPCLQDLGDLRTLTLGASSGLNMDTNGAPFEYQYL